MHVETFLVLSSVLFFQISGNATPIKCEALGKRSSVVEREICSQSKLIELDRATASEYDSAKNFLKNQNLELLKETDGYFYRQRNNCQNADSSQKDYKKQIETCVERVYQDRLSALKATKEQTSVFSLLTDKISFYDVNFVNKYGKQLVDRKIRVLGVLSLDEKKDASGKRLRGAISDDGQSLQVRFKSMPDSQANFLDNKRPDGHHFGVVKLEGSQMVFEVSSILGTPLP